jgi:hypothetical protein
MLEYKVECEGGRKSVFEGKWGAYGIGGTREFGTCVLFHAVTLVPPLTCTSSGKG